MIPFISIAFFFLLLMKVQLQLLKKDDIIALHNYPFFFFFLPSENGDLPFVEMRAASLCSLVPNVLTALR